MVEEAKVFRSGLQLTTARSACLLLVFLTAFPKAGPCLQVQTRKPRLATGGPGRPGATPEKSVDAQKTAPARELAEAAEAAERYLKGVKTAELSEGRQILAETQWITGPADRGQNFYSRPRHSQINILLETLFETDLPNIRGYKRLSEMTAVNKLGQTVQVRDLLIAYKDQTDRWKVLLEYADVEGTDIQYELESAYKRLNDTKYSSAQKNYASYGKWLLVAGKIKSAEGAFRAALEASPLPDDCALCGSDEITRLQIREQLSVISRIAQSSAVKP